MLSNQSIYERLTLEMMEYIALGIYQPEERLPSVRELSSLYHVNPNTIAKVYANLETDGYVYAIPAKGYYVANHNEKMKLQSRDKLNALLHLVVVVSKLGHFSQAEVIELLNQQYTKEEVKHD